MAALFFAERVLERAGFCVLSARHPEDALLMAKHGPIDLLATDIGLPGFSGRQLAERVQQANPEAKVLFLSGYPEKIAEQERFAPGLFIRKPFRGPQLVAKVREVLAATHPV